MTGECVYKGSRSFSRTLKLQKVLQTRNSNTPKHAVGWPTLPTYQHPNRCPIGQRRERENVLWNEECKTKGRKLFVSISLWIVKQVAHTDEINCDERIVCMGVLMSVGRF